jgi:hypothetical protein
LKAVDRPLYDLPRFPAGIDPTAIYELAQVLVDRGAA